MLGNEYPVINTSNPALMELTVRWRIYIIKNKYSVTRRDSAMKNTNREIIKNKKGK